MSRYLDGRNTSFWIGVQPTDIDTVQYNELPRVSGDFEKQRTYTDDETITAKRESKDTVLTGTSVSGDFTVNLRLADNYKKLRQGALQAYDSTPVAITAAMTYTDATKTLAGADFQALKSGDYFGVVLDTGETKVVVATADGTATDILIAGLDADATITDVKADKLTSDDNSIPFMLQKRSIGTDGDGGPDKTYYRTFTGVEVFQYTLTLASESILSEAYTLTGMSLQDGSDLPTQGSDVTYDAEQVLGSVKGVSAIWFDGSKRGCFAQSFDFSIDNQGSEAKAIGTEGACFLSYGDPMITGNVSVYTLKSQPYEYHELTDSQRVFPFAVELKDAASGKILVVSGNCKATTVEGAPETGAQITNMGLKFIGNVSFTYI